jgi:hypothetical protein
MDPQANTQEVVSPVDTKQEATPNLAGDWRESIPEDLRGAPSLKKFEDVGALAKSYIELEKRGFGLPVPNDKWTEKEWEQLYDKLGRPESPEGYGFSDGDIPEGMQFDKELQDWFSQEAHKVGLSKKQAFDLRQRFIEHQRGLYEKTRQAQEAQAKAREEELQRLKIELGQDYKASLDAAQRVVNEFGDEAFKQYLQQSDLGNDPHLIRFMIKVGQAMADDKVILQGTSASIGGSSSLALAEINRLKNDKAFHKLLMNPMEPGHAEAKKRWQELHRIAYS